MSRIYVDPDEEVQPRKSSLRCEGERSVLRTVSILYSYNFVITALFLLYLQRPPDLSRGTFCNASVRAHYGTHMRVRVRMYVYVCVDACKSSFFLIARLTRECVLEADESAIPIYLTDTASPSSSPRFLPRGNVSRQERQR